MQDYFTGCDSRAKKNGGADDQEDFRLTFSSTP
jgi:hypothetical protein